ncbi:MAG: tetratricopeptide repeat protein, partial [Bacteroidota bacterium]
MEKIDSLESQLNSSKSEDVLRVDLLNEAGYEYWIINPEKSVKYGEEALDLSEKLDYQNGYAKANRVIGVAYWAQGNQNRALEYLITSQTAYEKIEDQEGIANTMLNIGMVYADLEQYELALKKYDQAIDRFTSLNLDNRIATTFTKMATTFINQGQKSQARKYLTNALKLHTKNN